MLEFPYPPRQFRRRTPRDTVGYYRPETDIVAVDPLQAEADGMGGDDGYYSCLLHGSFTPLGTLTGLTAGQSGITRSRGTASRKARPSEPYGSS